MNAHIQYLCSVIGVVKMQFSTTTDVFLPREKQ